MNISRQTGRALHDEHRSNLDLLGRIEGAFARPPRGERVRDPELLRLAGALERQVAHDVERHFEFEERELFARMADAGDGDIVGLLSEEHDAIRDVAHELRPLARAAAAGTLDEAGWATLSRCALELVERQVAHIQKEEMALLPLLEDLLDDDTDARLAMDYTAA